VVECSKNAASGNLPEHAGDVIPQIRMRASEYAQGNTENAQENANVDARQTNERNRVRAAN
jgi:hypothetical protein